MKRIFVDTNVLLDLLLKRRNFSKDAEGLFYYCKKKGITPHISSLSIATINYILSKIFSEKEVREKLEIIYQLVSILPFNKEIVFSAHHSSFKDLEDAFQYFTAKKYNIPVIITRNQKDFLVDDISIVDIKEFFNTLAK
ncbi:type II toxin-antitoxin system VapC family toxin [Capnocytophaga granulosa]|uniref:type II toxin-antitoxin system VapC family toxin n=1 Tax=Capnocytophaga granulosa TaxID=45242 RepID=UPI00360E71F8